MSALESIDSFDFARAEERLDGSVAVERLKRLEDVLHDTEGRLDYSLRGTRDERNRPQLAVTVAGHVHLQCQRCLGLLDYDVAVDNTLLLVERGTPHDPQWDDPDAPDVLEASTELDVLLLIEDEILLSLPIAPRHAEGTCESRLGRENSAATSKPFAQLEALKGSRKNT